jgi:TRAP-type mannitol/chloroaromatic compound transport system substrate-binding protein
MNFRRGALLSVVARWPVFEMPLLGYTGYLPFGLECALAVAWLEKAAGPPALSASFKSRKMP